ncbi:unnamed protein product [Gongylonema pulchrum]|uniref:NEDD8-activating enzyme E1 regulatory subunit n=1 Tax=Gongylonema pulchrum TaxID=637853 RepID=A0A183EG79_9BILA|nr:unnamed protein product [Gongylonema pulchrum]
MLTANQSHPGLSVLSVNLHSILSDWDAEHTNPSYDTKAALVSISKLLEEAEDEYIMLDPDPLDERRPFKRHPSCVLGHLIKVINRNEEFINKFVF